MSTHGSASALEETPHETERIQITISEALRRRAEAVINGGSIDPQWRNIVRYALEINDPLLPDFVRRAAASESIIDTVDEADPSRKRSKHWQTLSVARVVKLRRHYSCSWESYKTRRIPKHLHIQRNTLLLLVAVS